jgi:hypothetical protein
MWREEYDVVCRQHRDLVAVFESDGGRIGLLLHHTVVPLLEEQELWLDETRRASRRLIAALRGAGLRAPVIVLQWRALDEVAHILRAWRTRYEGGRGRLGELTAVVARVIEDRRFVAARRTPPPLRRDSGLAVTGPEVRMALSEWYRDMTPSWLAIEPPIRRLLVLRTHRCIVERVLLPLAWRDGPATDDLVPDRALAPDGPLAQVLLQAVPAPAVEAWRPWVRLVVADLRAALVWPAPRRDASWVRWLFLIPYSVPVSRPLLPEGDRGTLAARTSGRVRSDAPRLAALRAR